MLRFVLDTPDGISVTHARIRLAMRSGKKVLWVLSGGSNIQRIIKTCNTIKSEGSVANLTIILGDERYGAVGHPDSNFQQLLDAGFIAGEATFIPVLQEGLSLEATADAYHETLIQLFSENDVVIGQLGMGPDGHIAGILPHSPASIETERLAVSYVSDPYQRVTMTFAALRHIKELAVCQTFGTAKREALLRLRDTMLPLAEQPAQILKELPEAYVFNDQIEEVN